MSRLIDLARDKSCYKIMLLSKQTPETVLFYKGWALKRGARPV